jgi:hypothetical protein
LHGSLSRVFTPWRTFLVRTHTSLIDWEFSTIDIWLLGEVPTADRIKFQTDYDSLLDNEKFWKYGADENAHIRKAVYHFLQIALSKWPGILWI